MSFLPKRPASVSPDRNRPSKRLATSSPEEGELDDATPPPPRSPTPPRAPPKRIPFPFKRKNPPPENIGSSGDAKAGPSQERLPVYVGDEDRRYRDDDERGRFGPPIRSSDDYHARGNAWEGDRWDAGRDRYERPRWESQGYPNEPRAYPRSPEGRPYRSPSPRRRSSRSRSPSSPRSPLTPSSGKEKHRLPPSRPVIPDPETYRAMYDRERWRDEDERCGRRPQLLRDGYDGFADRREGEYPLTAAYEPSLTVKQRRYQILYIEAGFISAASNFT